MRKCKSCNQEKELSDFYVKRRSKDVVNYQSDCIVCTKAIHKQHYQQNKNIYLERALKSNELYRDRNRRWVWHYLLTHPCIDCNETNPIVLEFDHVDPKQKVASISRMITACCSIEKIEEEIMKCEIRCSNCHRIRTATQFGWACLEY